MVFHAKTPCDWSTKDIDIYTSNDKVNWTWIRNDHHSTWRAFPNAGTTTEWTPKAPSKYVLARTLTNYGDTQIGGRLSVVFLQLKFAVWPN